MFEMIFVINLILPLLGWCLVLWLLFPTLGPS